MVEAMDEREVAFEKAFEFVMKHEGEVSSDPWGGPTLFGISRNFFPEIYNKVEELWLNGRKDRAIEEVKKFYKREFWYKNNIHKLETPWNIMLFDTAVNMGLIPAGKILQQALNFFGCNLVVDGIIGRKTLGAVESVKNLGLVPHFTFLFVRLEKYFRMETRREYWRGFFNRVWDLAKEFLL